MNSNKRQTLFFSLDQIIDSGLVFIFIAIGGNLLDKSDMANVVLFQSVALVSVLFCSCFTTQYLLLRYKKQSSLFWLKLFLFFCIITMLIVSLWFQSAEILFLFFVGISSEYIKRYCFYINNSCLSFFSTIITAFIFFVFILMCWLNFMRINSTIYIYIYSGAKLIPLTIICCFLFIKTKFNSDGEYEMPSLWYAITDSLRFGGVFSVITIIYWITNQGFFIFFHDRMPAAELVEIRVTQNVFGVVTMLIALYDSMFLKKNIENKNKIFDWRSYFKFLVISIVLITFNFILLYILSITIYKHLDVFKYSICLALAQFFYLSARMPVLILKLRYSLSIILWLYVCSLFLSSCYLFLKHNDYDFQYIVQSITLSNFFIFLFSLLIVFYKERIYGKNY